MSLKSTLRRAAGLLVELPPEEEEAAPAASSGAASSADKMWAELEAEVKSQPTPTPTRTVEQIVRDTHGPNLDQIQVPADTPPPSAAPDGKMDFSAIYRRANLPTAPFTAEQILDMIASLPQELPLDMRRQTVRVTLNAMGKAIGVTPDTVVADASRKLAALSAYTDSVSQQTAGLLQTAERDIAALQQQIEEKRKAMLEAQQLQAQVTQSCQAESHRLDDVLEFFSLDISPSKYAAGASETPPPTAGQATT